MQNQTEMIRNEVREGGRSLQRTYLFIYLFIYTRKIISTNMLKELLLKKYPNIVRYKNQLIYTIAVWEPKEEK